MKTFFTAMSMSASVMVLPTPALAQSTDQDPTNKTAGLSSTSEQARASQMGQPTNQAPAADSSFNQIIVTGRAAGSELRKADASYSITTISSKQLQLTNPISTAEVFKQVPGFWVEASGGEGSNNVRARGIPTDGYSSVSLQENGLPVQYDGGLGYLNADQSFRLDNTVQRVEAVRGGPASIYAPYAPGGVVNFITRTGTQSPGGYVKLTWGDYDLARIDGYYGEKIGDNWGIFFGGFYRQSHGQRDMGFMAEKGGQFRATLNYDDGEKKFLLDFKHIDDKVPFYLPVPLTYDTNGNIIGVPGFDPFSGTLAGGDNTYVAIRNVGQPYYFDLTEGSHTKLNQITLKADLPISEIFAVHSATRYKDANILRDAVFPTGNVIGASDYLTTLRGSLTAFPGATSLQLRYANGGAAFPADANGNGLVVGGNLLSVSVPIQELITDNRLTADFEMAGKHSLALGFTYGHAHFRFDRYMGTSLMDVRNNPRRLDVVALNNAGNVVGSITDNGFLRYGSIFDNVSMNDDNFAIYGGDEWQITPKLRLDAAGRWEQIRVTGAVENKTTADLGDPNTLADNNVLTGTGTYTAADHSFHDFGWTIGANYQFARYLGAFARYTDTFRLPSGSDFNGNPARTDDRVVPIKMAELGFKYGSPVFSAFLTGFYTKFEGISFTDYKFNTTTNNYEQTTVIASTETYGVEAEAMLQPTDFFDFSLQATYQDPRYKGFAYTAIVNGQPVSYDYSNDQLIRMPKVAIRAVPALTLFNGMLRTELAVEYYSKRYPDIANSQVLPAYTVLNFAAQANLTHNLQLELNVTNLTNTLGLTEGNPRAGSFNQSDPNSRYFLARPIFGRTVRASVSYKF